jgi:hypothetical protein
MNKRQRMYASNLKARNYLLNEFGASEVWFKKHTRRLDKVFIGREFYFARDLFNLFDGIALVPKLKKMVFFQVKTSGWAAEKPLLHFKKQYPDVFILVLNVRKYKGHYKVFERQYK